MESYLRTIDAMASFPNTLGVHAAHEIVNRDEHLSCMPVIVAVVRDLKRYMKLKHQADGQRVLSIGYGASHHAARAGSILEYLSSRVGMSRIDFFTVGAITLLNSHRASADSMLVHKLHVGVTLESTDEWVRWPGKWHAIAGHLQY